MKGALKSWMETRDPSGLGNTPGVGDDLMELQQGDVARDAMSPSVGPSHLTDTLKEAHQKK
jgi:hypothetical protein